MTELEFQILNSLSDDYECLSSLGIDPISLGYEPNKEEIVDTMKRLMDNQWICLNDPSLAFDRDTLISEPKEHWDSPFWFGLTPLGAQTWENHIREHDPDSLPNWNQVYKCELDFERLRGSVESRSSTVCNEIARNCCNDNQYYSVDISSFVYSKVRNFHPKYYKQIGKAHRVDFRLQQHGNPPGSWISLRKEGFGFLKSENS